MTTLPRASCCLSAGLLIEAEYSVVLVIYTLCRKFNIFTIEVLSPRNLVAPRLSRRMRNSGVAANWLQLQRANLCFKTSFHSFFKRSATLFETPITKEVQEKLRSQMELVLQTLPEDLQLILKQS